MSEIDPIEFGKLVQAVETMTVQIGTLTKEVDGLKQTITGGRGVALGLIIAAGGVGAGLTKFFDHLMK